MCVKKCLLFVVSFLISQISTSQDLETVLKKHFEAIGQESLKKIRSVQVEMVESDGYFSDRYYLIKKKEPNKISKETTTKAGDFKMVYDGDSGQVLEGWLNDSIRALTLKERTGLVIESAIGSPLQLGDEHGNDLSYLGFGSCGGKECYRVRLNFEWGTYVDFFIESSTFHLYKYTFYQMGLSNEMIGYEFFYVDYRNMGEFTIPYAFEMRAENQRTKYYSIKDLIFGIGLSDHTFQLERQE